MLSTTLSGNYGFPLCLSGITQQLTLSRGREMAEHEQRRKGMMKKRRSDGENVSADVNHDMGAERDNETWLQEMREGQDVKDIVALLQDLGWSTFPHTAKAA